MKIFKPAEEPAFGPTISLKFPLELHNLLMALARCSDTDRKEIIIDAVQESIKRNMDPNKNSGFLRYLKDLKEASDNAEAKSEVLEALGVKPNDKKQKAAAEAQ